MPESIHSGPAKLPAVSETPPPTGLIRILSVEDNRDHFELIGFALERSDPARQYAMQRVEDGPSFKAALDQGVDVILCDYNLPQFSPYAALRIMDERGSGVPLIVVTQAIGEEAAVNVLRHGAKDYLTKDKLGTLPQAIDRVLGERERALERESLARELEAAYARLKMLSSSLVVAQERERTLISRELHDVLGQTLTGMVIHLHAARRSTDAAAAAAYTDTAMQMAQEAVTQVRTLSFALRPAQLDLLGLTAAITTAVQRIAEPSGLAFEVTSRGIEPKKLRDTASVAVRIVQPRLLLETVGQEKTSLSDLHDELSADLDELRMHVQQMPALPVLVVAAPKSDGFSPTVSCELLAMPASSMPARLAA